MLASLQVVGLSSRLYRGTAAELDSLVDGWTVLASTEMTSLRDLDICVLYGVLRIRWKHVLVQSVQDVQNR